MIRLRSRETPKIEHEMSEWQPIDTAPKDGSLILIGWHMWSGDPGGILKPCVAFWSDSAEVWMNYHKDMGEPGCWLSIPGSFNLEARAEKKRPESKGLKFTADRGWVPYDTDS